MTTLSWLWPYHGRSDECPNRDRHRGPEGPNEDIAQCGGCGSVSYSMRSPVETTTGLDQSDSKGCSRPGGDRG